MRHQNVCQMSHDFNFIEMKNHGHFILCFHTIVINLFVQKYFFNSYHRSIYVKLMV